MARDRAFWTESHDNLRAELTDLPRQFADYLVKILAMELAVRIVKHDSASDLEDFAGGGKLFAAQVGEVVISFGVAAVAGGLARGETDYAGFDVTIVVEAERASEASGFVVGMSGDAHQAEHGVIVTCGRGGACNSTQARWREFLNSSVVAKTNPGPSTPPLLRIREERAPLRMTGFGRCQDSTREDILRGLVIEYFFVQ